MARQQQPHYYQLCRDVDCPRWGCIAYKEGRHVGYDEGHTDGYTEGEAAGYSAGFAEGLAAAAD